MAFRSYSTGLISLVLVAALAVSACGPTTSSPSGSSAQSGGDEEKLRKRSAAMQKTILEGAIAGAALGGVAVLGAGLGGVIVIDSKTIGQGVAAGALAGAAAGTYVAFVQRKYARKEDRLEAIKSDLDENSVELQKTINVMRRVLAAQTAELAAVRADAQAGRATSAQVQAEVTRAKANLAEMRQAIDGASQRQAEFGQTRGLVPVSGGGSAIDPELAVLSEQIATMKAIASDLAKEV